jgi:phosphatidylglycerol:prolipoprotein diacylglycerol transferase
LNFPDIDPIALSIGPVAIHWYGVMYLVAFLVGGALGLYRAKRSDGRWTGSMVWDLVFYVAVGAVLGGRLGYVLFYNATYYLSNPIEIFSVWTGGMSFHGGLLGVIVAVLIFAGRFNTSFFAVADFLAPLCAPGLMAGRIGNFINQELWGRVSEVPWAVVFPAAGPLPRHPSQLYEAGLEGVVLFFLVWFFSAKPRPAGRVSGMFLLGYAVMRLVVEMFREPDAHLGFIFLESITMGQILSIPVGLFGLWLLVRPVHRPFAAGR